MTDAGPLELEVVIEPDVVPRGTLDVRALDAPPGARPPRVRVLPGGLVVPLEPSGASARPVSGRVARAEAICAGVADTGAIAFSLRAQPAPAPAPAPAAPASPAPAAPDLAADLPARESTAALDALEAAAAAPVPPRPPAAEPGHGRSLDVPREPFEQASLAEVSVLWTLGRFLAYLLVLTASVLVIYVHLWGIAPWQRKDDGAPGPSLVAVAPEAGQPAPTEPAPTEPAPTEPAPTEPAPTEPAPTEPAPTEPAPTEPAPTEPAPTEPAPTEPAPAEPAPAEPAPAASPTLEDLRALAAGAGAGGQVGVEEETPGIVARIEGLRAQAARALEVPDLDAAADALERLLALSPEDGDALFRLGLVLERRGDPAGAEARHRAAAAASPRDARPLNQLGLLLLARGDAQGARAALEQALARAPEDPDVLTNLANLVEREAPTQAHPLLDKALERDPAHGPARLARARVRAALGEAAGARSDLAALVEASGPLAPRALEVLALLDLRAGDRAAALEHLEAAAARTPRDGSIRANLGVVLLGLGRAQDARGHLLAALEAEPGRASAWRGLGVACLALSDDEPERLYDAKDALERAIKLGAEDWLTRYNYGLCAERFGNFLFAMREYERAIALRPDGWEPYANLARLYARADKSDKALELLDRGLAVAPGAAELHYQRAWLLLKGGREREGKDALRRFAELAPADPRLAPLRAGLGG